MLAILDPAGVSRVAGEIKISLADMSSVTVDRIRILGPDMVDHEVYKRAVRLAVSPASARSTHSAQTNTVTVSAVGGTPPYSHSWSVVTSAGSTVSATAPSSATTAFKINSGLFGDAIATDTVTDSLGLTASINVGVSIDTGSNN